jgi:hypothetical protein
MQTVKNLPIQHCNSLFCIAQGRYWDGRIVVLGDPGDTIIGWCNLCHKYVCSQCTLKVPIPEDQWAELPNPARIQELSEKHKVLPQALQCKRCGSFLGMFSDILVWERILK